MSQARATINLILAVLWTLALMPVQVIAKALNLKLATRIPMRYHAGLAKIMGLRIVVRGTPSTAKPTLFAVNHSSWLDITVIDCLIPVCFVAKQQVAGWPLFGTLARLQRTVFVERKRNRTGSSRDEMKVRLEAGDNLVLFPEGTSGDGNRILPFRSSFFALAEQPVNGKPLTVQPVSIAYVGLGGAIMGRHRRPEYTWFADMDLAPHLWRVLGLGPVTVVVEFHRPVTIEEFTSRKEMAAHAHREIAQGLSGSLAGRGGRAHRRRRSRRAKTAESRASS